MTCETVTWAYNTDSDMGAFDDEFAVLSTDTTSALGTDEWIVFADGATAAYDTNSCIAGIEAGILGGIDGGISGTPKIRKIRIRHLPITNTRIKKIPKLPPDDPE